MVYRCLLDKPWFRPNGILDVAESSRVGDSGLGPACGKRIERRVEVISADRWYDCLSIKLCHQLYGKVRVVYALQEALPLTFGR